MNFAECNERAKRAILAGRTVEIEIGPCEC